MNLTPLGDRVLIKPTQAPQQTVSGLHLAEHRKPEQTGTVIAVGRPAHPRKDEAFALATELDLIAVYEDFFEAKRIQAAAELLRDLTGREPEVKVGDFVAFSWAVGQEIWIDDGEERYLLMRESDILAVVEQDVEGVPV